ncbi:hypothetical protein ABMA28_003908 [Loxostege sticticalis]|uniref:Gustatory receptor n=1 Tax=Loxostege sticticalis TaxID=481309 RepID=A0ABD0STK5_LOXSC
MFGGIPRPRVDVPEFTRCCFCLPLRYGLLTWGYLKMIVLSVIEYTLIQNASRGKHLSFEIPPIMILFMTIIILDLISTAIFIVGGHMKHRLLYKVYYYYSIYFLILFILIFVGNTIDEIIEFQDQNSIDNLRFIIAYFISYLYTTTPLILVQIYVILLVRSELLKLSNSNFQFVNNAAEGTRDLNRITAA